MIPPKRTAREAAAADPGLAVARSFLSRALEQGLRPPDAESLDGVFSSRAHEAMLRAALVLGGGRPGPVHAAVSVLAALPVPSLECLKQTHLDIFGHTLRGRVCPYETEYGKEEIFQQAQELADIIGFYLAFGLEPAPAEFERSDHIACEFEFLGFLSLKEAYAIEKAEGEMLETTRGATRKFLREHLGAFGRAFGIALGREDPGGYYGALGGLCSTFLTAACGQAGVAPGPEALTLRPGSPPDVPSSCGDGPQLHQIGKAVRP